MSAADWIALAGIVTVLVGGLLSLLAYTNGQFTQERTWREEADAEGRGARERLEREFNDYKLYVANHYVSISNMRETEERLAQTMEKIAARLETIVTRLERLAVEVATANAAAMRYPSP